VTNTRAGLIAGLPLLFILFVTVGGFYGFIFLVCRYALRFSLGKSALAALAASAPNVGFMGPTVLGSLYGSASSLPIAVGNLVIVVTVLPLTLILLSVDASQNPRPPDRSRARVDTPSPPSATASGTDIVDKIVAALTEPIVWLPLLGFILVLIGLTLPGEITNALSLLGHSASGVALFAAGIVIAAHKATVTGPVVALAFIKNVVQPALVWVGLLLLGFRNPLLGEAVVTAALPILVVTAMLAVQYRTAETDAASALFISMVGSLVTLSFFIALTGA
jgi:malonate transporter and related proteins